MSYSTGNMGPKRVPSIPLPSVEVLFSRTPDGLQIANVILKPARAADEPDLRRFLERVVNGLTVPSLLKPLPELDPEHRS